MKKPEIELKPWEIVFLPRLSDAGDKEPMKGLFLNTTKNPEGKTIWRVLAGYKQDGSQWVINCTQKPRRIKNQEHLDEFWLRAKLNEMGIWPPPPKPKFQLTEWGKILHLGPEVKPGKFYIKEIDRFNKALILTPYRNLAMAIPPKSQPVIMRYLHIYFRHAKIHITRRQYLEKIFGTY